MRGIPTLQNVFSRRYQVEEVLQEATVFLHAIVIPIETLDSQMARLILTSTHCGKNNYPVKRYSELHGKPRRAAQAAYLSNGYSFVSSSYMMKESTSIPTCTNGSITISKLNMTMIQKMQ